MSLNAVQFLSELQGDLASRTLELEGFPASVVRLLRELRDPLISTKTLTAVVSSDAVLASRLLGMSNAVAHHSSGVVSDVGGAIARVGQATLRTVALAHAFSTLRDQKAYQPVQQRIGEVWARGLALAGVTQVVAAHAQLRGIDRETLTLGAMLSGVGKIHLLAAMAPHEEVLADFVAVEHLLRTWHLKVARVLLEQWEFPAATIQAATDWQATRPPTNPTPLFDVVRLSSMLVELGNSREEFARCLIDAAPASRLGLSRIDPDVLFTAAQSAASSFRGALA